MRLDASEFKSLQLWAHTFLADVPLHDAFALDLPGGGEGRTLADVRALLPPAAAMKATPLVAALFKLRFALGRIFGWDSGDALQNDSYLHKLTADDRSTSLVSPGTQDGPFRVLHALEAEAVSEIQNATVHAFLCEVLQKSESGYRYYWGVYVRPVSRFTPLYMALIKPFRHWLVYPAILGQIQKAWIREYAA